MPEVAYHQRAPVRTTDATRVVPPRDRCTVLELLRRVTVRRGPRDLGTHLTQAAGGECTVARSLVDEQL